MGAEFPWDAVCGPGLQLVHGGRGVILNPGTRIGSGCVIYHGVTIGTRSSKESPVLGDGVLVGTHACILGPISIGDEAKIGAGAVVLRDVPAGATAVGVPASLTSDTSQRQASGYLRV